MPYNTRRKSLSLPSLGIHVPVTHAERAAAVASRASAHAANLARASAQEGMDSPMSSRDDAQPSKRLKRSHSDDTDSSLPSPPVAKRRDDTTKYTPPPSPPARHPSVEMDEDAVEGKEIDMEGINDDIVEAVIVQLQETGNRPHLVKELTAVLMQSLKVVQQSANPCAIISSRLSTYLKRPCWSALSPCPLAKELETVHPRRTYFYLTTCPHQSLPDPVHAAMLSQLAHARTIVSPSLSSVASVSEDTDMERRRELSPSPEVDLSSPEFDDMDDDVAMPSTPIGSLSMRGFSRHNSARLSQSSGVGGRSNRAASPPLEKDEKEFTQTADGLQKRKMSGDMLATELPTTEQVVNMDVEYGAKEDTGFFGDKALPAATNGLFITSPTLRPSTMSLKKDGEADMWAKLDSMLEWDRSPENVELDELDGLLNGF